MSSPSKQVEEFLANQPGWEDGAVAVESMEPLPGGFSSDNWLLFIGSTDGVSESTTKYVLRREPRFTPVGWVDLEHEYRLLNALEGTPVPAPDVFAYCDDPVVFERPFFVMEFIEGTIPDYRDITDQTEWQDESYREALADEMLRVLGRIQDVDLQDPDLDEALSVPEFSEPLPRGKVNFYGDLLKEHIGNLPPFPIMRDALHWLRSEAPPCDEPVLSHGDYRIGNFVWQGTSIAGVLDWEGAMPGDPMQDLGYACHPIMRREHPELISMLVPRGRFYELYERRTGRTVNPGKVHYYTVYALFFYGFCMVVGLNQLFHRGARDARVSVFYQQLDVVTRYLVDELEKTGGGHRDPSPGE